MSSWEDLPAPKIEYYEIEESKEVIFEDCDENFIFFSEIEDDDLYNGYYEFEMYHSNFNRTPGTVIQFKWEREYWSSTLNFDIALDFFVRLLLQKSFEEKHKEIVLLDFFQSDTDYRVFDRIPKLEIAKYEYGENKMREFEFVIIHSDFDQKEKLYSCHFYALTLLKWLNKKMDDFLKYMELERFKYIDSIINTEQKTIEELIEKLSTVTDNNEKGIYLEKVIAYFLEEIEGFEIKQRIRTSTEEIDIVVYNNSDIAPWKDESKIILVECKNWQKNKVGKNEYVLFLSKLENRFGRSKLGFIISSSGFTKDFHKEMTRNSKRDLLIIPIETTKIIEHLKYRGSSSHDFLRNEYFNNAISN